MKLNKIGLVHVRKKKIYILMYGVQLIPLFISPQNYKFRLMRHSYFYVVSIVP